MQVLENDLAFLQASAPILEEYLLSDVLYYPVTGLHGRQLKGDTTRLTLGNLLLSQRRLTAAVSEHEAASFAEIQSQIEQTHTRWRWRWDVKIQQEIPNRLLLWRNYLSETTERPSTNMGDYPYNVRLRVILELLMADTSALLVQEKETLRSLDTRLKAKGQPGAFVWEESLTAGFPPEWFWYLYLQF